MLNFREEWTKPIGIQKWEAERLNKAVCSMIQCIYEIKYGPAGLFFAAVPPIYNAAWNGTCKPQRILLSTVWGGKWCKMSSGKEDAESQSQTKSEHRGNSTHLWGLQTEETGGSCTTPWKAFVIPHCQICGMLVRNETPHSSFSKTKTV